MTIEQDWVEKAECYHAEKKHKLFILCGGNKSLEMFKENRVPLLKSSEMMMRVWQLIVHIVYRSRNMKPENIGFSLAWCRASSFATKLLTKFYS